jgi:hypothetical protein
MMIFADNIAAIVSYPQFVIVSIVIEAIHLIAANSSRKEAEVVKQRIADS